MKLGRATAFLFTSAQFLLLAVEFPSPYNSETSGAGPIPAAEAVSKMQLPPGFKATVFAAEPDVQNPIAMAWDARGRLWVAENYTYAESAKHYDLNLRDRILIFEDKDGDGHFDSRKVFTDELQMLTSIEIGYDGVWVMCPPQLLFIPDKNRDDAPDITPEVVLDGFTPSPDMYHTFANGLRFGPDGWLYGRCGASSGGEIGVPGTPAEQRIPLRGTMWRYHPRRKVVEVISSGTTNPWGHDWNEHGELFFINTVNGHLWHEFAGAHFMRPHTFDPNPRAYELIDQHADHWHFDTAIGWQKSRDIGAPDLGGGHAHVGMMIYQGDNWPDEYRGHLFTLNLHGRRMNQEILERSGSGYVGKHGADFFIAGDPWFRGMEVSYGPDGGVFVLDWSDTGDCHDYSGVHRTSGRIYKITYGTPKHSTIGDLRLLSAEDLVKLHTHRNEWFSRQARLELTARAREGRFLGDTAAQLRELFEKNTDVVIKLRALWTLYTIGATDEKFLREQMDHPNEHVRAWAVRLLTDDWPLDTVLSQRPAGRPEASAASELNWSFSTAAQTEKSGLVRLAYASAMQRLPVTNRVTLAMGLLSRREDANDHNLPLMIWYGLIPAAEIKPLESEPLEFADLLMNAKIPLTRRLIARRLAEDVEKKPAPVNRMLQIAHDIVSPSLREDIVNGMTDGLVGWRKARKPEAWDAF
ncbi:MAG TPA: PVC-type heme-binding CxxCH protein, partial [Verrucomicrobiae bacterium]